MDTIEGRSIDVIELLKDYDLTVGTSKILIHEIGNNCVWNLQVICKDLAGVLNGTITIKGSNQNTEPSYFNTYATLDPITLDSAQKSVSIEDSMCTHKYLIVDFAKVGLTGGTITLLLKVKSA